MKNLRLGIYLLLAAGLLNLSLILPTQAGPFKCNQGGTGISTTTPADVGKFLMVSSSNPCVFTLSTISSSGGGGVNTSTINYFAFYGSATAVTGTPLMQLTAGTITFSSTTVHTNISATSVTTTNIFYSLLQGTNANLTNVTSTNLNITGLTNLGGLTFTNASGTNINISNVLSFLNANGTNVTTTNINVSGATNLAGLTFTTANGTSISSTNGNFTNLTFGTAVGTSVTTTNLFASNLELKGSGSTDPFNISSSTSGTSMFHVDARGNVRVGTTTQGNNFFIVADPSGPTYSSTSTSGFTMVIAGSSGKFPLVIVGGGPESGTPSLIRFETASGNLGRLAATGVNTFGINAAVGKKLNFGADGPTTIDLVVLQNHFVGIGSTTPLSWFSVQPQAGIHNIADFASSSGATALRILDNGYVGVNTGTPRANFSVDGNTLINGGATSTNLGITARAGCNAADQALQTDALGAVTCGTLATGGGGSGAVNTSTANYLAVYLTGTSVTGTPLAQITAGTLTFSSTTVHTNISATSVTSTNLYISSLANLVGLTFGTAIGTSVTTTNLNVISTTTITNGNLFFTGESQEVRFSSAGKIVLDSDVYLRGQVGSMVISSDAGTEAYLSTAEITGGTQTYTFPDQTGTFALTSDLNNYLLISASTSLAYLGYGYPALATSTFISKTASTSFPNLTQVGTLTNLVWTNATGTNINITGLTNLANTTITNVTSTNLYISGTSNFAGALTFTTANGTSVTSTNAFFTNLVATSLNVAASSTFRTSTIAGGFFQSDFADCSADGQTVNYNATTGKFTCLTDANGSVSINGAVSSSFNFTTSSDTNIRLAITTSTDGIIFNPYWIGTLADARITSAATWNAKLGPDYPAIATSSFLGVGYPAIATSTFLAISASTSLPNLAQVGTLANLVFTNATGTNLNITGLTNLANTTITNVTSTNLSVSGISGLAGLTFTNATGTNANISGLLSFGNANGTSVTTTNANFTRAVVTNLTATNATSTNLSISGLAALGALTFTNASGTNANISNLLSFANANGTNVTSTNLYVSNKTTLGSATTTFQFFTNGHINATGTIPTVGTCGTSPSVVGSDHSGYIQVGSVAATACTLTFAAPYVALPSCTITNRNLSVVNAMTYVITTSSVVVSQTGLTSNILDYVCWAHE